MNIEQKEQQRAAWDQRQRAKEMLRECMPVVAHNDLMKHGLDEATATAYRETLLDRLVSECGTSLKALQLYCDTLKEPA